MTDLSNTMALERLLVKMREYIDGEIEKLHQDFAQALEGHVFAINELQEAVGGLKTELTLSVAFDGDAYRRFILEECARMDVKPSELAKVKREVGEDEGEAG